ncbi:MAG: outer membrane beta-barrel protein, partial [Pseudomonadota bacterium]
MKSWVYLGLIAAMSSLASAQTKIQTTSGFEVEISGLIDVYYLHNQNGYNLKPGADSSSSDDDYDTLTFRNYDDTHGDLVLNLFELTLAGSFQNVGFYADLDYGNFAEQNAPEDQDGVTHQIGQAFLIYNWGSLQFRAGKMYTNIGFETPKAYENWNTSRSFAYMIGTPTWHEGLEIKQSFSNGMHWAFYVYDSFDAQRSDNNEQKTLSAQVGFRNDKLSWVANSMAGNEADRNSDSETQNSL